MSVGLCVYELQDSSDTVIAVLRAVADEFDLSRCFVDFHADGKRRSRSGKTAKFDSLAIAPSDISILQFSRPSGEEYMLLAGLSPYVSYVKSGRGHSSIIFYLPSDGEEVMERPFWSAAITKLQALYGFATVWDRPGSFWAYAAGFADGGALGDDLLRPTEGGHWGTLYRSNPGLLEAGFFRDVYSFNFLSTAHVNRHVEGRKLMDLVSANSPGMGAITEIASDWYLWQLSPPSVPEVRKRLRAGGVIEPMWQGRQARA